MGNTTATQSSPSNPLTTNSKSLPNQRRGIIHHSSGKIYNGELKDNKTHGRGILKTPPSDIYDGEWKKG